MKHTLIIFCLLLSFVSGCSQQENGQAFRKYVQENFEKANKASDNKNYKQAEAYIRKVIAKYDASSEEVKLDNINILGSAYYDLACYLSLQNKKKPAVDAFAKAVENEWCNYSHAKTDKDLDNVRSNEKFQELMQSIREKGDYLYILQQSNGYENADYGGDLFPRYEFTYMNPNDSNLVRVRLHFNLDSIAGYGDEISKIKNLMTWVHNVVRHDGSSMNPDSRNAIDMVELCRKENRGINCRMMAQVLNECYLAMGFKSRFVTCMPKVMVNDCHVINAVYSNTLDKWIWMDPTFNAWVTDDGGNLLGISEVRQRLKDNEPLVLNEDANWNNEVKQTKESYLGSYMAKNLYYLVCCLSSEYNSETEYEGKERSGYMALVPKDFTPGNSRYYKTSNEDYFWQSPYNK